MRRVMEPGGLHPEDPPGKERQVKSGHRVLVVDGLAETEEVLKAVLEPQGLEVNRIRTHFAQDSIASKPPHLVILHEDRQVDAADSEQSWPDVPRVIIGSIRPAQTRKTPNGSRSEYLAQPFQYGDLIRAVEQLLAD